MDAANASAGAWQAAADALDETGAPQTGRGEIDPDLFAAVLEDDPDTVRRHASKETRPAERDHADRTPHEIALAAGSLAAYRALGPAPALRDILTGRIDHAQRIKNYIRTGGRPDERDPRPGSVLTDTLERAQPRTALALMRHAPDLVHEPNRHGFSVADLVSGLEGNEGLVDNMNGILRTQSAPGAPKRKTRPSPRNTKDTGLELA